MRRPQLRMSFDRFYDLPPLRVPQGYRIETLKPGREADWAKVLTSTGDLGRWDEERAHKAFTGRQRVRRDSVVLVYYGDEPVATACVQEDDDRPHLPELGWVAVVPEHRGKGLGKVVSMAVINGLFERGFRRCILRTDDFRLPAIKTYLDLGFAPEMLDESHPERWAKAWEALGRVPKRPFRIGVVGRRGAAFIPAARAIPEIEIAAFCDIDENTRREVAGRHGITQTFGRYEDMLEADLDAVILGTPMPLHVPQAVAALQAGKHVLCEVTAAVTLEECWALLEAVQASGKVYMMAENYCYIRENVLVRQLVRKGFFGEVYFGQGEYIHELKALNEQTPWRRRWQTGRNGNTYPTHSLGPLMQWMDERVVSVCCMGSGHHYVDAQGRPYENEDTTLTLCKLERGGMVQLRLDMLSNRPHAMTNYSLQGTRGCYESGRRAGEEGKVWFEGHSPDRESWSPLSQFEEHLPADWLNPPQAAREAGHWGADYWLLRDFADALCQRKPSPIDVVRALEWTSVGLCSEISIARGGAPVDVPDFRAAWQAKRFGGVAKLVKAE
jgi:Predicted dehydrogenases and related proteins